MASPSPHHASPHPPHASSSSSGGHTPNAPINAPLVDFVHDVLLHGDRCLTLALLPGTGGAYDEGEHPPLGALTLRLHRARGAATAEDGEGGGRGGGGGGGGGDGQGGGGGGGYIEILTCAVRRTAQRSGVGTLLARWVLRLAAATSGVGCALVAASGTARTFWEALGFGEPPPAVPAAWVASLRGQFEGAEVLHYALPPPLREGHAEGTAAAPAAAHTDDDDDVFRMRRLDDALRAAEARVRASGLGAAKRRASGAAGPSTQADKGKSKAQKRAPA